MAKSLARSLTEDPTAAVTQSLACYSPNGLRQLLAGARQKLTELRPGGAHDHEAHGDRPQVHLEEAMQYLATPCRT